MMALFEYMKNLYLIGMRGVGKSTIGSLLAQKIGKEFVDMDKKIEQEISESIQEFVKDKGWDAFREQERQAVETVSKLEDVVVSTGGGVLMYFNNAEKLKATGKLVLLTAELETIRTRLSSAEDRPSLTGTGFLEELERVWNERKDRYHHFADQVISTDGKNLEDIIQEILLEL